MKTWKVESQGESWSVDAPDDVTEAEVNAFAAANYASWTNGGRYRMDPAVPEYADKAPGETPAAPADATPTKEDYDAAVGAIDRQLAVLNQRRLAQGGPGNQLGGRTLTPDPATDAEIKQLTDLREQFAIGGTGQFVGGVGGALGGAVIGAGIGTAFVPGPGTAIGALLGSIAGGVAGTAAGTHLYDIPAARETREVTDQEAAELIEQRAFESLIYDGAFTLILGPGGRAIGKMSKGAKFLPALKAAAKESFAWDKLPQIKRDQLLGAVAKRADVAPKGLSTQASRAIGAPTLQTSKEATEQMLIELAEKSGGRLPTKGEMSGLVTGGEAFTRRQAPAPFFKNDKLLAETAVEMRESALKSLDAVGAYTGPDFGVALKTVQQSADRAVKNATGPIFERAAAQKVQINMTPTLKYLEKILFEDMEGGVSQLRGNRPTLEKLRNVLKEEPWMSPEAVQRMVSGLNAETRALVDGSAPTPFAKKALGDVVRVADSTFVDTIRRLPDKSLAVDLEAARKLYGATMKDLYSDTMATMAGRKPEDVGAMIVPGTVTEIREMRAAVNRALSGAPAKTRIGVKGTALGVKEIAAERTRIDAGLIKGFIEQHTQSLTELERKIGDPKFKQTLKELLTGEGVADRELGRRVLQDLDRTLAVLKVATPEMAPQPGRFGLMPGVGGSVGGATTAAAAMKATGAKGDIAGAVPLVYATAGITRVLGKMTATAMTSGNLGIFRTAQRAITLSRLAGTNTAAAEALRHALKEIHDWDVSTGGPGLEGEK